MCVIDHTGKEYSTVEEMCDAYGIGRTTYDRRIKECKWDMKKALETPVKKSGLPTVDHNGTKFRSCNAMCKHWGITIQSFKRHLKNGKSIKEALTSEASKGLNDPIECEDHLGMRYKSEREMCRHYGISIQTYKTRIKCKWTVEKALTTKPQARSNKNTDKVDSGHIEKEKEDQEEQKNIDEQ